jgi:hypothetical protein
MEIEGIRQFMHMQYSSGDAFFFFLAPLRQAAPSPEEGERQLRFQTGLGI